MERKIPLYRALSRGIGQWLRCKESKNEEWQDRTADRVADLVKSHMPYGGGIASGTTLDFEGSTSNRLVFDTSYHHMNDTGYYDGWTDHRVIATPDLESDFDLRVTGRNRNQIKEYLGEIFVEALRTYVDPYPDVQGPPAPAITLEGLTEEGSGFCIVRLERPGLVEVRTFRSGNVSVKAYGRPDVDLSGMHRLGGDQPRLEWAKNTDPLPGVPLYGGQLRVSAWVPKAYDDLI